MRLTAIEKPSGLFLKLAYLFSKREFGTVISPLKFIYARCAPILPIAIKMVKAEKKLSLSKRNKYLIRYFTSHLNDCSFCSNAIEFGANKESMEFAQWKEFLQFKTSEQFTAAEKALLTYIEEINYTKTATEETFANLKRYFSEQEIVEITWVNSSENYYNLMAKPLGLKSDDLRYVK